MSRDLDILNALLRDGTFVAASESLGYTQSYLSQCVHKMEDSYGVAIVDRGAKPLRLTDIGEKIYAALEQSDEIDTRVRMLCADYTELKVGSLRIGSNSERTAAILSEVVASFTKKYPGIKLNFPTESHLQEVCSLLTQGKVDVGICFESHLTAEVDAYPLFQERFLLVLPKTKETEELGGSFSPKRDYPALPRDCGALLSQFQYIQTQHHPERLKLLEDFIGTKLQSSPINVRTVKERLNFVAAGAGISICQESLLAVNAAREKCVYVSLNGVIPNHTVVIAWAKRFYRSQAAKAFCQEAKQYYSKLSLTGSKNA